MKAKRLLKIISKGVARHFTEEESNEISEKTKELYYEYCRENQSDSVALKEHTEGVIYAGAALYRALQAEGKTAEEAFEWTNTIFQEFAGQVAEMIRKVLKIPGLYKCVPWAFRVITPKKFSEAAGFRAKFYDVGKRGTKFDMTQCPYFATCRKLGCPELTPLFCNTDDCCYGNMHPKLKWHRTKTIGRGADLCDFEIMFKD